jgi:PBP1b-binding outer membrane lipoprotein LpoB
MKLNFVVAIFMAIFVSACASTGAPPSSVERITPEELAKLMPPAVAIVSLDEIVAMSRTSKTPDEIIEIIKTSNSRYELTPTQVLDLNKQGVDAKVLDYIGQANELAKQNAIADELNKRNKETLAAQKILKREQEIARNQLYYDPFWGARFGAFYGRPYYGPIGPAYRYYRGSRLGWGLSYGYPFGW